MIVCENMFLHNHDDEDGGKEIEKRMRKKCLDS